MRRVALVCVVVLVLWAARYPVAQEPASTAGDLVSTWTLISVERGVAGEKPERIPNPRGLLIFDSVGHVFEFFTTASRQAPETPQVDSLAMFNAYGGFWGGYRVDTAQKRVTFKAQGAISIAMQGREFSRSVEQEGNRLTMTSIDELHTQGGTRWTWQRVPTIDHLSPFYRQTVGFWEHVVERRVNVSTGAVVSENKRAPSVIVYTPSGYVGVHFPPLNRQRFAGAAPTDDEARAAIAGVVSYYGSYTLYPGLVFHHRLVILGTPLGDSLRRFYEIAGDELNLKFPAVTNQGQEIRTVVTLKRISGEKEMMQIP